MLEDAFNKYNIYNYKADKGCFPCLCKLVTEVDELEAEHAWTVAGSGLERLSQQVESVYHSDEITQIFNRNLERLCTSQWTGIAVSGQWILEERPHYSVQLKIVFPDDEDRVSVASLGRGEVFFPQDMPSMQTAIIPQLPSDVLSIVAGGAGLSVDYYDLPKHLLNNIDDNSQSEIKLRYRENKYIEVGDMFSANCSIECLDIRLKNFCVLFQVISKVSPSNYIFAFNRESLMPEFASPVDIEVSRLESLIDLVSHYHSVVNKSTLVTFSKNLAEQSAEHMLRWKAIKLLLQVDFKQGLIVLKRAKDSDPNSEVRDAAAASLEKLHALQAKH